MRPIDVTRTILMVALFGCSRDPSTRVRLEVPSSADGTAQPANLYVPPGLVAGKPVPLAVLLHTWSYDLDQRHRAVEQEAATRGWLLLAPNFRGRNDHPEACGSALAQQDVLDAVAWVRSHYAVDSSRIYVLGLSGGGHMTMLMVGREPSLWAAASAWVGIGDLARYHEEHATDGDGESTRKCLGGAPGASPAIDADYRVRSPVTRLAGAVTVPLDIAAGRKDGEVAFSQSIGAFNVLAAAQGAAPVSAAEIAELESRSDGLLHPTPADTVADSLLGRRLFLRRLAGPSRLTIFDGSHEWMPSVAVAWLAAHQKQ